MTTENTSKENYKRFSEWWERARDTQDEDGDNILIWDKSVIANFSFTEGFHQGKQETLKKVQDILDNHPNAYILETIKQEMEKL